MFTDIRITHGPVTYYELECPGKPGQSPVVIKATLENRGDRAVATCSARGDRRDLTADEIVGQARLLGRVAVGRLDIVFGGEPLLNLAGLLPALKRIRKHFPNARLLVRTAAPYDHSVNYDDFFVIAGGVKFDLEITPPRKKLKVLDSRGLSDLAEAFQDFTGKSVIYTRRTA